MCSCFLQIVEHSPPVEDIPWNIDNDIRDLIMSALVLPQHERPTASQLLQHRAFSLIGKADCSISVICFRQVWGCNAPCCNTYLFL